MGEQQNLPIEFVDGYISQMSVSIPWSSLLSDSSFVEVVGLMLTIQPKQRADSGKFVCNKNLDVYIGKLSCYNNYYFLKSVYCFE